MSWTTRVVLFLSFTVGAVSQALATDVFVENFNQSTLSSKLAGATNPAGYDLSPLTPGATWEMVKQAGVTTGSLELKTRFLLDGDFSVQLLVNRENLGTGEVGLRVGEMASQVYTELYLRGTTEVRSAGYYGSGGGYGLASLDTPATIVTLKMIRNGTKLSYFMNNQLFSIESYAGPAPISIFFRPDSGVSAFNPNLGQPDAHAVVLDNFFIAAIEIIPEPTSCVLLGLGLAAAAAVRRRRA
jgi:hypothetical protein